VADVARFEDEEVLSVDFGDKVGEVVAVMAPFVHMCVFYPDETRH
jgi:hypothetical protein